MTLGLNAVGLQSGARPIVLCCRQPNELARVLELRRKPMAERRLVAFS